MLKLQSYFLIGSYTKDIKRCEIVADIGIIVDSSGSLRKEFHKEINFVRELAKDFTVTAGGVNLGVVTFSYYAKLTIKLSDNSDTASFLEATKKIPLMRSQTYIDRALQVADAELFNEENGDRRDVPNFIVLLTDGKQTKSVFATSPSFQAAKLRDRGVTIFAIGIGRSVDEIELASIAGSPENMLLADSFEELLRGDFRQRLVSKTCRLAASTLMHCLP